MRDSDGPSLVIMAAGAARRYGGLKQLAPVGPNGEAMMEYSIHDAFAAGFSGVVLVVRREFESAFAEKFVTRARAAGPVEFAYQDFEYAVPERWRPVRREKPWGTAHAVLCAHQQVDRPFAVINADDYYGPDAFEQLAPRLQPAEPGKPLEAAMVGYDLLNTLSDNGTVNRGICEVDAAGKLVRIAERYGIARAGDGIACDPLSEGSSGSLPVDATTSMNMWGYPAEVFEGLQLAFTFFLDGPRGESQEFELPSVTQRMIDSGRLRVQVSKTSERWCGMTYQDDLPIVQERLATAVRAGIYPQRLW